MDSIKTVIVTGGGQGLGRAIALRLAGDGYQVALLGRTAAKLEATAKEIEALGAKVIFRAVDAGDEAAVRQAFADVKAELGAPTVLVNNAGGWSGTSIEEITAKDAQALISSIILSTVFCSKAAIPMMRGNGGGTIINIGSTSGLPTSTDAAIASAPKAAIASLTAQLALEVEADHIRVAVVHPGNMSHENPDAIPQPGPDGRHTQLGYTQVADVVGYIAAQPANVSIQEVVITPANELR